MVRLHGARSAILIVALAALASCGGGGGSGAGAPGGAPGGGSPVPAAPLALNSTNAPDVAAGATLTGLGASSLSTQFQNALRSQPLLPRTHLLSSFLRQQIERLTQGLQSRHVGPINGAVMMRNCTFGGTDVLDLGATSASETFSACSDVSGLSVDGTISVLNMTLDPGVSFSGTAGFNLTFKEAGFADVNIVGSDVDVAESVNVSVNTVTLTGTRPTSQILVTTGTVTERLANFVLVAQIDASSEADDVTFDYGSTKIGGQVRVTTVTPCVTDTARSFPHAGLLEISGSGGSKIQVTVNGDETLGTSQVKIDVDANGDGTFESTLNSNWADLAA